MNDHFIRRRGLSPRILQEADSAGPPGSLLSGSPTLLDPPRSTLRVPGSHLLPTHTRNANQHHLSPIPESRSFADIPLDDDDLTPHSAASTGGHELWRDPSRTSQISSLPSPEFTNNRCPSQMGFFASLRARVSNDFLQPSRLPRTNSQDSHESHRSGFGSSHAHARAAPSPIQSFKSIALPALQRAGSRISKFYTPQHQSPKLTDFPASTSTSRRHSLRSTSSGGHTSLSSSSVDSGRAFLFPGIKTSERFTHKWPKPEKLKKLERSSSYSSTRLSRSGSGSSRASIVSFSDGSSEFSVDYGFEHYGLWTVHKWFLMCSVVSVFMCSVIALIYSIMTWYQTWIHSDVMLVADADILVLITLCASLFLLASLIGLTGTLLNSRPLLALYALLLWPAFVSLLSIGYASYRRSTFALDRKLNFAWSQGYTDAGRAVVQDSLRCCGFTDPGHEASYDGGVGGGCYPRSLRPGCKGPLLRFEKSNLEAIWKAAFATVPLHISNIVVSLLCSNHVNRTFGTGITPRSYRLRVNDVRADARGLLEHFTMEGEKKVGLQMAGEPPRLARTASGMSAYRDDKIF